MNDQKGNKPTGVSDLKSTTAKGDSEKEFRPYISPHAQIAEFTWKAIIPGIIFGVLFGAANAYLGAQAGLTISTSIPLAVMTVGAFRLFNKAGMKGTLLEANLSQTIGSASSSIASGAVFTLPALYLWGFKPELLQMTLLGLCGGLIGILFMIPLRTYLIDKEHKKLPYPEGTACSEVLKACETGGNQAQMVFLGLGVGALFKLLIGWIAIGKGKLMLTISSTAKMQIGMKMSSALFGVGYILGPRIGAIMVGGGLLSSLVIIPLISWWGAGFTEPYYPESEKIISKMSIHEIWNMYVRYIGAGAVAVAGMITLIKSIPTMIKSFQLAIQQLKVKSQDCDSIYEPKMIYH